MSRCWPVVPPPLRPALRRLLHLIAELLLRGGHPATDEQRLVRELDDRLMAACVKRNFVEWELGRIVASIAHLGPAPLPDSALDVLWPPSGARAVVRSMTTKIQRALVEMSTTPGGSGLAKMLAKTDAGWPLPSPLLGGGQRRRGRGQPADAVKTSVLAMAARETLFPQTAAPVAVIARAISSSSGGSMNPTSAYRRMKKMREVAAVPRDWHSTLLSKRLAALHVDQFAGGGNAFIARSARLLSRR